ncbi:unnamed protein product [Dibothriocephalus latus]|uniref:Fibrillar collagen NC1 domain-containing protein n=1 Tax=Dibothriocephalus latus TaxID=60516 RepID=A0A3P6TIQ2_DIBLA|nr:unnamed protein product [Dibothriocephalus latus]
MFYAPRSQMNFLQLLHHRAEQSVTVMCRKSVVYYDNANKNYNSAADLLLSNGDVINSYQHRRVRGESGTSYFEIKVKDGCADRSENGGTATFDLMAKNTEYLPVLDMKMFDFGDESQLLGYYVDAVCFS